MNPKDHKDWVVWKKSMDLVTLVYQMTSKFPRNELHGLSSQMQRSAVSIPSNIAEGYRRINKKELYNFCRIAYASAGELETQLEIAKRLKYIKEEDFLNLSLLLNEVVKILASYLFKKSS